ncbi:MAG: hypothetical protein M3Y04_08455 [Actinomycetota bacterium]|nr:hypothetical protein [Actinomycetota bacterium]
MAATALRHHGDLSAIRTVAVLLAALTLGSCSPSHRSGLADPSASVGANPDYGEACAPSGLDTSLPCVQVTLQAVDNARAKEGLAPMALPATFAELSVPQQVLVVVNRERMDRGRPPFVGLSVALDDIARQGADASDLPPDPQGPFSDVGTEWIGAVANGLDADYSWMYDDGPGSGVDGCTKKGDDGCWADRHLVLGELSGGTLVMGAAVNATADTSGGDIGGPSLAATFAVAPDPGPLSYTWDQALAAVRAGVMVPRKAAPADTSATHIPDPARTVPAVPDYIPACASSGLDSSPPCLAAALLAVNNARAKEGVKAMVLPADFGRLDVAQQLLVVINLERIDRGLPPFVGRTPALDRNAQQGADIANDPPDPGDAYDVVDGIWAGGSSNALDADYGWMYDDGIGSGNLDCPEKGGSGCWGHRHGILDNFGSVGTLIMGGAVNPTGDNLKGDEGGTSIAATLAVTTRAPGPLSYPWVPPAGS